MSSIPDGVAVHIRGDFYPSQDNFTPVMTLDLGAANPYESNKPATVQTKDVTVDLSSRYFRLFTGHSLKLFLDVVLRLPRLQFVEFDFDGRQWFEYFHKKYRSSLEQLEKSGKLHYWALTQRGRGLEQLYV